MLAYGVPTYSLTHLFVKGNNVLCSAMYAERNDELMSVDNFLYQHRRILGKDTYILKPVIFWELGFVKLKDQLILNEKY